VETKEVLRYAQDDRVDARTKLGSKTEEVLRYVQDDFGGTA